MPFVTLKQPHTHGGVAHRAGERIEVDANAAHWLVDLGIATADAQAHPAPKATADAAPSKTFTPTKE